MKKILVFLLLLPFALWFTASAQILTPLTWTWKTEQVGPGEYNLIFTAKIQKGWHTYTQYMNAGDMASPIPTSLTFDTKNKDVKLIGKAKESGTKPRTAADPIFDNLVITSYEKDFTLVQRVKVLKDTRLTGMITTFSCREGACVAPIDDEFTFVLKRSPGVKIEWEHPKGN
jgi:thiol:disulfide interchange protein DsbD